MSAKRKALLLILANTVSAILLVGLALCVFWTRLNGPKTLWLFDAIMMAIFVGYMIVNLSIQRANSKRIHRERAEAAR
jgi:hypothetical protein